MNAEELVKQFGRRLIGRQVITEEYGAWPGGIATITKIAPDSNAPEIVFEVFSNALLVKRAIHRGDIDDQSIGVFDHENVTPMF